MIKNTNEHLDYEIDRGRSGRVLSTGTSVPVELEYATLWHMDVFANSESPHPSEFRDFYGGLCMYK